jgi:hypothetical protein
VAGLRIPAKDVLIPLLVAGVLAAGVIVWAMSRGGHTTRIVLRPKQFDTTHYTLYSYASPEDTKRVAQAAEALHDAYGRVFADLVDTKTPMPRLQMVLYGTRGQFKANNRSSPWAEAYYQRPRSYAYYGTGAPNPYHWMVHEATHQLNTEWAHLRLPRWISEGVASYFGTSRIENGVLRVGETAPNTYPAWWLPQLWLSGNLEDDLAHGRLIPLRALITDTGPDINQNVNLYYIEYWTLVHFLLEDDVNRYGAGFKALLATDGSLKEFERLVGPVDVVQREWYSHLARVRADLKASRAPTN